MADTASAPAAGSRRSRRRWLSGALAAVLLALGITASVPPQPAQASIVTGDASQDCNGVVTFSGSLVGLSLGYTLSAYAGRTDAELSSGVYLMGRSKPQGIFDLITASVSGTWQSPWPGQDIEVAFVPDSFPWGSFALNTATRIKVPAPKNCPVSVGDFVWSDTNRNGVQDAGEAGIPNVTVRLLNASGTQIATRVTDANGFYSFTGLTAGSSYSVQFVTPAGYAVTRALAGSDRAKDSNPNASGIASFTAPSGGRNSATSPDDPTIDAGLVPPIDLALSKTLTSAAPFRPGGTVTYTLTPRNNGPSDALGGWSVTEVPPPGLSAVSMSGSGYACSGNVCTNAAPLAAGTSAAPITVTATIASNADGVLRNVAYVSPAPGDVAESNPLGVPPAPSTDTSKTPTNNDADAPLTVVPLTSIGDTVWVDTNRNGVQDPNEPGMPGATVRLLDAGGAIVATTTTDAKGFYVFANLPRSTQYTVRFTAPTGYAF
ncbi:SdrD B-like domain-containing protein, partial [Leucobacter iarius]|uniref:SdrD B-like domain-containing protein n=1 Tax=Leucobacter iarius TaxID=333963 RepID=UPI0031DE236D